MEQHTEEQSPSIEAPVVAPEYSARVEELQSVGSARGDESVNLSGASVDQPSTAAEAIRIAQKTPLREDVEAALTDEQLRQLYAALDLKLRDAFRAAAWALASRVETMIANDALRIDRAHEGIANWLAMLPGVNPWFLIQEAKVKTDALLALVRNTKNRRMEERRT